MTKARMRGRQTTITFVYMRTGARDMLERAEAAREGQVYALVASLIFSAFTLEAYFNHLGRLLHTDWEAVERGLPKLKKYTTFAKEAKVAYDLGARPYRTMVALFAFRDRMAHGRTTTEDIDAVIDIDAPRLPQLGADAEWQAFATVDNAKIAIADVEHLIKELHAASGQSGNPFASAGGGLYGVAGA